MARRYYKKVFTFNCYPFRPRLCLFKPSIIQGSLLFQFECADTKQIKIARLTVFSLPTYTLGEAIGNSSCSRSDHSRHLTMASQGFFLLSSIGQLLPGPNGVTDGAVACSARDLGLIPVTFICLSLFSIHEVVEQKIYDDTC